MPNCSEGADIEIDSASPFESEHYMEIAPCLVTHSHADIVRQSAWLQRATELLQRIQSTNREGWQCIVTLDELYFSWEID
jgi:hypothetical protein